MKIHINSILTILKDFSNESKMALKDGKKKIKEGNLGFLFTVFKILLNLILGILPFMLLMFLDKARHLVFNGFSDSDPAYTTLLICVYATFCDKVIDRNLHHFTNYDSLSTVSKKVITFVKRISSTLPVFIWLIILLVNHAQAHIISIFITILFLTVLIFLGSNNKGATSKFQLTSTSNSNSSKEQIAYSWYVMILIVLLTVIYCIILYEVNIDEQAFYKDAKIFLDPKNKKSSFFLPLLFLRAIAILYLLISLLFTKDYAKNSYSEFFNKFLIFRINFSSTLLIATSLLLAVTIGSTRPLDIIVLYTLFWRMTFQVLGSFAVYFGCIILFSNSKFKRIKRTYWILLGILVCFLLLTLFKCPVDQSEYLPFKDINREGPKITTPLSKAIRNRFETIIQKHGESSTVYIFNGQGGGSRAGSSMFSTLSLADSIYNIGSKTIAITTISGSSNGTALYLARKKALEDSEALVSVKLANENIYTTDFITHSLFKYLFRDNLRNAKKGNHRNNSLIDKENAALLYSLPKALRTTAKKDSFLYRDIHKVYSDEAALPIFIPVTYNISKSQKAVFTPFRYDISHSTATFDIIKETKPTLSLGQGVALSEMFPVISGSTTISGDNYMDGGVYDNVAYEVAEDIYRVCKKIRDSDFPNISIKVVSVLNDTLDVPSTTFRSNIKATLASAIRSIFVTNTNNHRRSMERAIDNSKTNDHYEEIKLYKKPIDNAPKNCIKDILYIPIKIFKIADPTEQVVMSRYLTPEETDKLYDRAKQQVTEKLKATSSVEDTIRSCTIYFDLGKSSISPEYESTLKQFLKTYKGSPIEINASCDIVNSRYNKKVAEERIKSVKNYLDCNTSERLNYSKSVTTHTGSWSRVDKRLQDRWVKLSIE